MFTKTKDEIAEAVYRVAPKVYFKYYNRFDVIYTEDDFAQDAYEHIQKLFDTGYIKLDRENMDGIIYSLLNSYFVKNTIRSQFKNKQVISWEPSEKNYTNKSFGVMYGDIEDLLAVSPDILFKKEEMVELGKKIIKSIIETFPGDSYKTYRHTYIGREESLGKINLSDLNLAKLFFKGYTLQKVFEVYGFLDKNRGSQTAFITKKFNEVSDKISEKLSVLPKEDLYYALEYVKEIGIEKALYQE